MLRTIGAIQLLAWQVACLRSPKGGSQRFAHTHIFHIAKTAGDSAKENLRKIIPQEIPMSDAECCWPYWELEHNEVKEVITFVRDPKAHVYSQWNHCHKNLDWTFFPSNLPPNFTAWLQYWSNRGDVKEPGAVIGSGFHCYIPINLQTRALSCWSTFCERITCALDWEVLGLRGESFVANISKAKWNLMHNASIVGLTDFYQESMCLAHEYYHHELPSWCNCENSTAWESFDQAHATHSSSSKPVDKKTFSQEELDLIKNVTNLDQVIYDAALERFHKEVQRVESQYGQKLLCRGASFVAKSKGAAAESSTALLYDFDA